MQRGALSMIDALGFRGIWKRNEVKDHPEVVIDKLRQLEVRAPKVADGVRWLFQGFLEPRGISLKVETTFLSDTVAIAAWLVPAAEERDVTEVSAEFGVAAETIGGEEHLEDQRSLAEFAWVPVDAVSRLTSMVLAVGGQRPVPIAYRGCITLGDFIWDGRFLVGPAVDEAADAMDMADGALVWLAPSAHRVAHDWILEHGAHPLLCEHDVPIKGRGTYRAWVVSPFPSIEIPPERYIKTVLETFGSDRIDIQVKRQNTERFLMAEHKRLVNAERPGGSADHPVFDPPSSPR